MFKLSKALVSLGIALSMVAASTVAAQAATPTLTHDDWVKTAGYLEMQAANEASVAYVAKQSGLKLTVTMDESMSSTPVASVNVQIEATKDASTAVFSMTDQTSGTDTVYKYSFVNGTYVVDSTGFASANDLPNIDAIMKRLGETDSTSVVLNSTETPSNYIDIKPSTLFDSGAVNPLATSGLDSGTLKYSEVTKDANPNDSSKTDFSYDAVADSSGFTAQVHVVQTFNADGLLELVTLDESVSLLDLKLNLVATQSVDNTVVVTPDMVKRTVTSTAVTDMSNKLQAEASVTPKANSIAAKAKTLAKKAKKALSGKHIADAAKSLKAKVTSIKNGVKLTGKVAGVSGSMCVVALKGKAVVNHC